MTRMRTAPENETIEKLMRALLLYVTRVGEGAAALELGCTEAARALLRGKKRVEILTEFAWTHVGRAQQTCAPFPPCSPPSAARLAARPLCCCVRRCAAWRRQRRGARLRAAPRRRLLPSSLRCGRRCSSGGCPCPRASWACRRARPRARSCSRTCARCTRCVVRAGLRARRCRRAQASPRVGAAARMLEEAGCGAMRRNAIRRLPLNAPRALCLSIPPSAVEKPASASAPMANSCTPRASPLADPAHGADV